MTLYEMIALHERMQKQLQRKVEELQKQITKLKREIENNESK